MTPDLFDIYMPVLLHSSDADLLSEIARPQKLLITSGRVGTRTLDVAYAPFEHVNQAAEIVNVGLTPGRQQMRNALFEARRCLKAGMRNEGAKKSAKVFASFSGPMRANLVAMLDSIGLAASLKMESTAALWGRTLIGRISRRPCATLCSSTTKTIPAHHPSRNPAAVRPVAPMVRD